ncbi:MAG: UDP-3-O-acyl-N-acetylglucosamine deacetylase [Deltaproteobacteria bacterium]|nr:UDP-3-O-acyl-N-acetylglucosamine deacetylase [Deltaproteobacteria bacterium]
MRRLTREFRLTGRGLHGGEEGAVRVRPAEPGAGLLVGRGGTFESLRPTLATPGTVRCTELRLAGGTVRTVEHLLAAVAGCGIRDARLEFEGPEAPILDGSALPWAERLLAASEPVVPEPGPPRAGSPVRRLRVGVSRYEAVPTARTALMVEYAVPHPWLGRRRVAWGGDADSFAREIAPARTFARLEELEGIFASGQARGGSLECAVVLGPDGPLGGPLRFPDEPARHKLLDLLGDLALCGFLPAMRVRAVQPHHAANGRLALRLAGNDAGDGTGQSAQ